MPSITLFQRRGDSLGTRPLGQGGGSSHALPASHSPTSLQSQLRQLVWSLEVGPDLWAREQQRQLPAHCPPAPTRTHSPPTPDYDMYYISNLLSFSFGFLREARAYVLNSLKSLTYASLLKQNLFAFLHFHIFTFSHLAVEVGIDNDLTITILSRYSDPAIIYIFLETPIMIHHDICLNKMPVKRISARSFFTQVQTVRNQF